MGKRSKFQAELLLRPQPPNAFDVLREAARRFQMVQSFPPGVVAAAGEVLANVLDEVDEVRAQKAFDKEQAKKLEIAEEKPGLTA